MISNWPSALAITYGQALSNSVLSGGVGIPTGNFTWTVPTNRPNGGTNSQSVTFTPSATNNYNSVTSNVSLVVNKASPVLTWTPSPATSLTYPTALSSTQLNATSSVAGTFSYNRTNGTVLKVGTNTLVSTFTPTDPTNYTDGLTITNTVVVAKGSNTITFGSISVKYVGDAAFNLTAIASSGLTVTYTSSNTNVATVLGSLVTIVGQGSTTITANQAGDSNWSVATSVTQALTVQASSTPGLQLVDSIEPGPAGLSAIDFADKIAFDSGTLVTQQRPATLSGYPLTDGGRIHIFTSSNAVLGSGPWSFRQTLTQPDSNYDTPSFGWALGVRDNAIFAGSAHTFRAGAHDGTGYIFKRSNSSANFSLLETWAEIPSQWAGYFTTISSMRHRLIIVSQGVNSQYNSYGGAYFYSITEAGVRTKIHSLMESSFDKGCISMAIASNTAAIFMGSQSTNHQIRIFGVSRNAQGIPTAITTNQLLNPVLGDNSRAGRESMDITEDLLAVGRPDSSTNGLTNSGAVDVYRKGTNGLFSRTATIYPPVAVGSGKFGSTLALVNTTLVVGSPGVVKDATNAAGALYIYAISTNGAASLVSTNRIAVNATYSNEIYGSSIFRESDRIAVGTSGGID
ncbi:MAG: hypothetical protein EBZ78_07625, partial [Verrucomicrobia bacterium]|nr:hypothetical protein [Verrucomicrobiota bacterium]